MPEISSSHEVSRPTRSVHNGDAIAWLRERATLPESSVVTSLPDVSEIPSLTLDAWMNWFVDAALLVMNAVPANGISVFFQSDIRREGLWVDKGALVARAAERAGVRLLSHKIVCRKPPGTVTYGRASYSHLLAYSREIRPALGRSTADVLPDAGFKPGTKAMGAKACLDACRFIRAETSCRTIVDPFCGWGTVLAVANAIGFDAVGVDLSTRMCRSARKLTVDLRALDGK